MCWLKRAGYDLRKRRKYRYKDDIKCISPWAVIYDNNFYYLLAYDGKKMRVYRIDYMEGWRLKKQRQRDWRNSRRSTSPTTPNRPLACTMARLSLSPCVSPNNMVGIVLDRFGRDVIIAKADDRHFRITVPVAISPQFYGWVFGLKNYVTIESPQSVVDGMRKMLSAVGKRYEELQ